ncbi:2-succinyl-5-enolpyruvyl-6-hydroxy-3-cyclohexene-1-carboxylic-acid synthase [Rothia halotolerans]|uniref:2-succinyl-5-enolpyruvyl-6-hydroxy-3- cyclohexene-1-carboxylic-acid synthase n=1 Tax=Rothia halotolerans TaxID=405770 RepID=UPI001EDF54FA|nr:2-succinyl-5-enolpyruvyl-6-hydroxy-3-cyclohexene-1-carboxylic-acid synthase [Rothia halotolerans]
MTTPSSSPDPALPRDPRPGPDSFLTAVSVLDTLIRSGMDHVVLAPGSRSAPLAYALAAAAESGVVTVHVRIDERSAGFTALGLAEALGRPVGVVTTSGTAVGELMPAVMEASHSEAPLAILSADRPPRLRGTGANQTTRQPGLFAQHARASVDLVSYPEEEPGAQTAGFNACLAALTGRDARHWESPSQLPRGPVQINVAFDDPLTPEPRMRETLRAWASSLAGYQAPDAPRAVDPTAARALAFAAAEDAVARRTVVIAGDGAGPVARLFAESRGLPLLAEPSSNARSGSSAVTAYRLLLGGGLGERIERIVLFGRPTLSRPVARLLDSEDVESVIYLPRPMAWADPALRRERPVRTLAEAAEFAGLGAPGWLEEWHAADRRADELVRLASGASGERAGVPGGLEVARAVWQASMADGATLITGSSNAVRDLDLAAEPGDVDPAAAPRVYANRGLAGIDGTIATASGIALAEGAPVRLLVGDLTFLHDVGSLLFGPGERIPRLQIVVFNDAGGGIFSTLEHGRVGEQEDWTSAVERFFGTPHEADIERLVTGYGHRYTRALDVARLRELLAEPAEGIRVIEVRGTRSMLGALHQELNGLH